VAKNPPGGLLIGHDYNPDRFPGVCRAAHEFCTQNQSALQLWNDTVWSVGKD